MQINLDRDKKQAFYLQIYEQMKAQIQSGEIKYMELLPPERRLALELNVNRTTILNAYNRLKQEGMIESRVGQGTRVIFSLTDKKKVMEPEWNQFFNSRLTELNSRMIGKLMPLLGKTEMTSFALGMADPEGIPELDFKSLADHFAREKTQNLLSQSPVAGFEEFRKTIGSYLEQKKMFCTLEQVMIISGSQQGIDLCARVLLQPGDFVVMEAPSFFLAANSFKAAGAEIIEVPVDEHGMQMERLEQVLRRNHPKFIYTIPTNQNPSSYSMSLLKRKKLLELAANYNTLILEDDAYADLNYEAEEIPSLYQLDTGGYVIYLKTFSKTICSGIRLGYMLGHKRLIAQCCALRQSVDIHPNSISQYLVNEFIQSGKYDIHLDFINRLYRKRRDAMQRALSRYAPGELFWVKPGGGYYFWCRLPKRVNASELFLLCARQRVVFMPGIPFFQEEQGEHYIRLNFTTMKEEEIEAGIHVVCSNMKKLMNKYSKNSEMDSNSMMPVY